MPEDWLPEEPKMIPDPTAEKPEEWDDEEDGDWVPDMVPNPLCEEVSGCGPWEQPVIKNPAYKVCPIPISIIQRIDGTLRCRASGFDPRLRTRHTRANGTLDKSPTPTTTKTCTQPTSNPWAVSDSSCGP